MEFEDYRPNSDLSKKKAVQVPAIREENKSDREEAPAESKKVISGTARVKKKSKAKKFANEFIQEDVQNVKSYVFSDVLIPALKKTIWDIVTNGLGMILGTGVKPSKNGYSPRVSYGSYWRGGDEPVRRQPRRVAGGFDMDDILIDDRGEAENVLIQMDEIIDRYGIVRVADFYDLVGISPPYTANRYGWSNITNAKIVRTIEGYLIQMPRPMVLD